MERLWKNREWMPGIGILALLILSAALLKEDSVSFLKWWLLLLLLGLAFSPLAGLLFRGFADRGYVFAKALGIGVPGFVFWVLVCAGILPFSTGWAWPVTALCAGVCWLMVWKRRIRKDRGQTDGSEKTAVKGKKLPVSFHLILWEEFLFLLLILMWTYFAGFRPEAMGTEKFMDYGFMASMMRSDTLPSADIWQAGSHINYYYGGQYYAVYLTRLSFTRVQETYHLMRAAVAAFAFVLPFSMVYRLLQGTGKKTADIGRRKNRAAAAGGLLAGAAVSFGGNMHYMWYGKLRPLLAGIFGWQQKDYWFPDSTRYIGYDPDVADKTIHEFPSYSFVLGDLHAHMVNLFLVLLLLGILYSFLRQVREQRRSGRFSVSELPGMLLNPHILTMGWLLGVFQWTNYWDFVIYLTVCLGAVTYAGIYRKNCRPGQALICAAVWGAELAAIAFLCALPFQISFETMVSGVGVAENHSLPHQLLLLWGLPAVLTVVFFVYAVRRSILQREKGTGILRQFFLKSPLSDLTVFLWGLCALGLVLIPELVYVRDIYEEGYARSNTMFKLTYQAFIMFGMCMGYIIVRFLTLKRRLLPKIFAGAGLACLLGTCCYTVTAVGSWYGNVLDPSGYQGLDATAFLEEEYPEDAGAIRALEEDAAEHPEYGTNPVIVEADGESYSRYCRVSAITGLPTVSGWYTHEWLWRGEPKEQQKRSEEIRKFYTGTDMGQTEEFLEKYQVRYIFVGSCEKEKYGDALNEEKLRSLGTVIYDEGTLVIRVGK